MSSVGDNLGSGAPHQIWPSGAQAPADGHEVVDAIDAIVEDLVEQRVGRTEIAPGLRISLEDELRSHVRATSNWVTFPWLNRVVRYPAKPDHQSLRTWRNRDLVTADEQSRLLGIRVAVFGLSVGSNIVDQLSHSGIGGSFLIADKDRVSPSNLNRIRASMTDVGLKKTTVAGRKLAQTDPYIEQVHLPDGYVPRVTDSLLEEYRPDLIFDEVDNLAIKAMIRRVAMRLRIPVIMVGDIGDRSVVDVERYDIDENPTPFNGQIPKASYEQLLRDEIRDPREILQLLVALNGPENISERLFASATNPELGGLPQLGATATAGAALADRIVRAIVLDRALASDRYVCNPDATLRLP